jgi:hypothetical protein
MRLGLRQGEIFRELDVQPSCFLGKDPAGNKEFVMFRVDSWIVAFAKTIIRSTNPHETTQSTLLSLLALRRI